jgi:adenosine deaminase CECR1
MTETVCTDRGPLRDSSSLSHEFYQVMVGDPRMTIHGWKQLAEWSIEHSCLDEGQIQEAKAIHAREWERFCEWIVRTFGAEVDGVGER